MCLGSTGPRRAAAPLAAPPVNYGSADSPFSEKRGHSLKNIYPQMR